MGGGGKGKGGGGGGDVDVDVDSDADSTTTLDIVGLDDIKIDADVSATTTTTNTQRIEVPDPIATSTELTLRSPDTIRTDQHQRNELAITAPIVTEMSTDLDVDVKPVVVDLCLTLGIKDPPRFCVSRPYDKRFGVSLFGREVVGVEWSGSSQFIVDDVRPGGFLAGIVSQSRERRHREHDHAPEGDRHHGRHADDPPADDHRPRGVRLVVD